MASERQTPEEIRRRLVQISDETSALDAMAFADKHTLNVEADHLRSELSALIGTEMEQANNEWAERAGRKNAQNPDEDEAAGAGIALANAQQGAPTRG